MNNPICPSATAPRTIGLTLTLLLFTVAGTACAPSASEQPIAHWRATPTETAATTPAESTLATTATPATETATPLPSDTTSDLASAESSDDAFVVEGLTPATFGEEGDDFDPSISSDGSKLVFASTQHRQTSDIYIKNVAGRVVTQLTNDPAQDAMPVFSPDGSRIAFASNRQGNWDIFIMSSTGGKALQLTDGAEDEVFPSWSPDGTTLVFSRQNIGTGRWEMWTLPLSASGNPSFIGFGYRPRWCPVPGTGANGTDRVLYQLGRERGSRSFGIWTIDVGNGTAGQPSMLASSREKAFINPEWSPDGEWIAYAQAAPTPTNTAPTNAELWMMHAEGEGQVRLTGGATTATSPAWGSTDRLFFVSNRDGRNGVWSMDMASAVAAAKLAVDAAAVASGPTTPAGTSDQEMAQVPAEDGQ